ncbi:hypothetical protein CUD01_21850 [Cellulomonas uda]|uniref:ScoMcrA-like N-terminal head domain-containing protein n=1 Tax=Cellulomonas uda TaxID=1714 RepID=A0A4Y3KBA2_CELUD|nr:hypothetical protein CUD01_21850 [Cellulomonas uda]
MATFSGVTRQHVLQAIAEYDSRGRDGFLGVYGYAPTPGYAIVHEGSSYDLPAVLGVAHRFATGRLAPSDEVVGSIGSAASILRKRGFEVTEPGGASAPAARSSSRTATRAPRTTTPRASTPRRTATPEPAPAICPTCSMTLPATGVCDYCT